MANEVIQDIEVSAYGDLDIQVPFTDEEGTSVEVPDYDFTIEYFVRPDYRKAIAWKKNGTYHNCKVVAGTLHCFFDKPMLGKGRLCSRKIYHVPSANYPDQEETRVTANELNYILV